MRSGLRAMKHRADRRDRGALRDEDGLHLRWSIEGEVSERSHELDGVAGRALEQPPHAAASDDLVETDLDDAALHRGDRIGAPPHFVAERNQNGDEMARGEFKLRALAHL